MSPQEILGVGPGATPGEIRAAWRRTARQTHPDTGGDPAAFLRARQAFLTLGAPGRSSSGGTAPLLVRRLGPPALALRWWRRRQDARRRPRVV